MGTALDLASAVAALFLVSLGLYLVYGLLRVINLAHGELVMLGAYTAALTQERFGFWVALAAATAAAGLVGAVLEWLVIRRLYHRNDLATLLATWGVSLCLCEGVRLLFGPSGRYVEPPTQTLLSVFDTPYPLYRFYLVLAAVLAGLACWRILHRTRAGLLVRAAMEDPTGAEAAGVNTRRVYQLTFIAGAALGGAAGALIAPQTAVTPYMGTDWGAQAFLVVILGGGVSLAAPVAGAGAVAGVRSLLNSLFGITPATIGTLLMAIVLLFVRPHGLLNRVGPSPSR